MTTVLTSPIYDGKLLSLLEAKEPSVTFIPVTDGGEVPEAGRSAEAFLWCSDTNKSLVRTLRQAPDLRWIHTCTAGLDQLWHPEIARRGIVVTRSSKTSHIAVAEWAMACVILLAKEFYALRNAQLQKSWSPPSNPLELLGSTICLIGVGSIGREIATRADALGMSVLGVGRSGRELAGFKRVVAVNRLEESLEESDVVVVCCPLTPDTRGMLSARQFSAMKPGALFVNVARGEVIDEPALVSAIASGRIGAAALDVFEDEPLPHDHPLWAIDRVVITPHTAWRSPTTRIRGIEEFRANLKLFLEGQALHNEFEYPA